MKKLVASLLIVAMSTSLLVGCGSSGNATSTNNETVDDATANSEMEAADDDWQEAEPIKSHMVSGDMVTYENDYITLTISELTRTSVASTVTVTITNKTEQSLGIYPESWYINGYRVKPDSYGYITIEPNAVGVTSEVTLPIEKLETIGLSNIGEIALLCELRDASVDMLGDNVIDTTLIGYQTSDYASMDTEMDIELSEVGTWKEITLYATVVPDGFSWCNTTIAFIVKNAGIQSVYLQLEDETDDVSIRSCNGVIGANETFLLGFWGTDNVNTGDSIKIYMDVLDAVNKQEVSSGKQEFTWTVK